MTERFWGKVDTSGECWEWRAYRDRDGYGLYVESPGVTRRAHRVAFAMEHGTLPAGQPLDHLCRNRACVRPSHLELVTPKTNAERSERAMRDHCVHGHAFTAENTYTKPNGCRRCRACHTAAEARRKERAKA